jgi:hypothetical protein
MVYCLARKAGLADEPSWIIGYASQHVDASIVSYAIRHDGAVYNTVITQDYGFWDESFPRTVYVPFHFFPGDPAYPGARRADGATNPLNTTPASGGVKDLLVRALHTRNLYRIGIALHTYADSFAHQNFSGILEDWNTVDPSSLIPSIGHAQALQSPDRLAATWTDPRLVAENATVRNSVRQRAAARMVYKYLATFNRHPFDDVDYVVDELFELLSPHTPRRSGEERILDMIIAHDLKKYGRREWLETAAQSPPARVREEEQSGYDKLRWLRDAALYRTDLMRKRPIQAREGFAESHLYRWNEAAKEHLETAWAILPADIDARLARPVRSS